MVELYVVLIQRGLRTLEQVPQRYRAKVEELLAEIEKQCFIMLKELLMRTNDKYDIIIYIEEYSTRDFIPLFFYLKFKGG